MTIPISLLYVLAAASILMALLWLVQRRTGNAGIVDVAWAASIGLAAVWLGLQQASSPERGFVAVAMGALWGARLALHIHRRSHGKPEDGRYAQLRRDWGDSVQPRMFRFYQFQAVTVAFFALPYALIVSRAEPWGTPMDWAALVIWLTAFTGEALADAQLEQFKRQPPAQRGPVCQLGLWRYSRHPNYFFEWLVRVTGIPATEAQAVRSKGEAYRAYQRTTSAFLPWFPRKADPCS